MGNNITGWLKGISGIKIVVATLTGVVVSVSVLAGPVVASEVAVNTRQDQRMADGLANMNTEGSSGETGDLEMTDIRDTVDVLWLKVGEIHGGRGITTTIDFDTNGTEIIVLLNGELLQTVEGRRVEIEGLDTGIKNIITLIPTNGSTKGEAKKIAIGGKGWVANKQDKTSGDTRVSEAGTDEVSRDLIEVVSSQGSDGQMGERDNASPTMNGAPKAPNTGSR